MKKEVFNVDNNIIELLERKDIFGSEVIMIYENNKYIGYINKYTEEQIFDLRSRLINGWSYKEMNLYI